LSFVNNKVGNHPELDRRTLDEALSSVKPSRRYSSYTRRLTSTTRG